MYLIMAVTLKEKIEDILADVDYWQPEMILSFKGILFRMNPKWVKAKAKDLVSLHQEQLAYLEREIKKMRKYPSEYPHRELPNEDDHLTEGFNQALFDVLRLLQDKGKGNG